jgi:hypothetical protein
MPSATPISAQDNPRSRTSHTRSPSPASIFVADVDGIRSSSARPPIKAHFGSDGGSAGTAWPTCHRCRCLPGDERGNPHLGENTDFKDDRVGRSLAISDASAKQSSNANSICGNASRTQRWPTLRYCHEPACWRRGSRSRRGGGRPWPPCHGPPAHDAAYGQAVNGCQPASWIT